MLGKIIRSGNFKKLPGLFWLALKHPLYIIPTLRATRLTMTIAQREYGNKHVGNTPENAFRHALWSFLIAKNCLEWKNDIPKAGRWTALITDKHEIVAPNPPLERSMDEHNNSIGIALFQRSSSWEIDRVVNYLKTKAKTAKKIENPPGVNTFEDDLVYISQK